MRASLCKLSQRGSLVRGDRQARWLTVNQFNVGSNPTPGADLKRRINCIIMRTTFPRRFYKQKSDGTKELQVPEKSIKSCTYCGTYFVVSPYKKVCSKYCNSWTEFWDE